MIEQPRSGDDCQYCDGHVVVDSSHDDGDMYRQYLRCYACKRAPAGSPVLVEAKQIKRRRRRTVAVLDSTKMNPATSHEHPNATKIVAGEI